MLMTAAMSGVLFRIVTFTLVLLVFYLGVVIILSGGPGELFGFLKLALDVLPSGRKRILELTPLASEAASEGVITTKDLTPEDLGEASEEVSENPSSKLN